MTTDWMGQPCCYFFAHIGRGDEDVLLKDAIRSSYYEGQGYASATHCAISVAIADSSTISS